MKSFQTIVVATILAATTSASIAGGAGAASKPVLEFRGLVIGEMTTPEKVQAELGVPCGEGVDHKQVCNGLGNVADHGAQMNAVIGADGVLDRIYITVSEDAYDDILGALRKKFGRPSATAHPIAQNGFGATFKNEQNVWNGPKGTQLYLERYAGDADDSMLLFTSKRERTATKEAGDL